MDIIERHLRLTPEQQQQFVQKLSCGLTQTQALDVIEQQARLDAIREQERPAHEAHRAECSRRQAAFRNWHFGNSAPYIQQSWLSRAIAGWN